MDTNNKIMDIKLVIFDLDGTLLNTIEDLAISVNHVLEKYGYPKHNVEQYKYFVGNGITSLIERAVPKEVCTKELVAQLQADYVVHYAEHGKDNTAPYSGIVELIAELKDRGKILTVASNKHHMATEELVNHYFGSDTFSVVYGKRDGVAAKPDPRIVFDIIEQCGVSAHEVLYIGDSSTDMQTAQNASVRSVGVTWGFRSREELETNGANHIIDSPMELIGLIDSPIRDIRRKERVMDEDRAREIILESQYGVLSMVNVDGGGYGIPLSYAVDQDGSLYFHCAHQGHKIDNLDADHRVTFTIVGKTEVMPDKFTTRYESVVIFGTIEDSLSVTERIEALRLIVKKYSPGFEHIAQGYIASSFDRTQILKLRVERITAKTRR